MGIKFSNLAAKTRTCTVEYDGDKCKVTYRPSAVTAKAQLNAMQLLNMDQAAPVEMTTIMSDFITGIVSLVVSWDILGDDGEPLPVTADWLSQFPMPFLGAMYRAIMDDMRPNDKSVGELTKFLTLEGKAGAAPDWYVIIRAAKYLGVPPWDLMDQPIAWTEWALAAESAENTAERNRLKHSRRK